MQRLQTYLSIGHKIPMTEGVKALVKPWSENLRVSHLPLNYSARISNADITRFRALIGRVRVKSLCDDLK